MTNPLDPSDADARIDAMARAAGGELRRPAPADGITRAQRSKRTKQTTRIALAGTAVLAVGLVGIAAFGGKDSIRVGPADTVVTTLPDSVSPTSIAPTTVPPTSTAPNPVGAPEVVYGAAESVSTGGEQTLFDPTDGSIIGTEPVDFDESRRVQDELYGQGDMQAEYFEDPARTGGLLSRYAIGGITYSIETLPSEITSLEFQDQTALPRFDRCGQAELVVEGTTGSALPERITSMSIGADRRYLVVLSATCPETGTLLDDYTTQPYDITVQVFDAANPDTPGRTLLTENAEDCQCSLGGFSFDGSFLAVRTFNEGLLFRVFDLGLGTEVVVDDQLCGQGFTSFADGAGPWVGATSLAVQLDCGESRYLLIRDLAPGGAELRVELITEDPPTVEVDLAHFDSPSTAWFTVCSFGTTTCWVGHGDEPLVELAGMKQASFVPLGFRYGG
jgi:hypothetical protein